MNLKTLKNDAKKYYLHTTFYTILSMYKTIRKDIKWIAITDIYEEFGIDFYDIEFEEFYFVDENTLILSDFKGIGTPSRTGIVFISKQAEDIYFEQRGNIKENGK